MLAYLKMLWARYSEDKIANHAAALSYYAIFSLGPLLFLVLGIIGLVVKNDTYRAKLLNQISSVMGPDAAHALANTLSSQGLGGKTGLAFWVGGVGLVLVAIGIFGQIQQALNHILHVEPGPEAGKKPLVRQKLISLILVGVVCILLVASVLASTFISSLGGRHGMEHFLFFGADLIASVVILGLALTLLYRFLPAIKVSWRLLARVSLVVALLFSIGKFILGIIIGRNGTISAYGAAGSLIALLLWIFYSGQILYIGAAAIGINLSQSPRSTKPRYAGKKAVLKVKEVKEPLKPDWQQKITAKFFGGVSRGWKKR